MSWFQNGPNVDSDDRISDGRKRHGIGGLQKAYRLDNKDWSCLLIGEGYYNISVKSITSDIYRHFIEISLNFPSRGTSNTIYNLPNNQKASIDQGNHHSAAVPESRRLLARYSSQSCTPL